MKEAAVVLTIKMNTIACLAVFYGLAAISGFGNIDRSSASLLDLLIPLVMGFTLGWWALTDAKNRGRPIPLSAQPWFVLLAPSLVPGYLVWTRGWRGVLWVMLHAIGWFSVMVIAFNVALAAKRMAN
ncbi:hypothetical protein ACYOEI_19230 [Singulisphaera rosea]